MELRRIAVCMDTEPESIHALEEVMPLARQAGAEIVLVHVGDMLESFPDADAFNPSLAEAYAAILAERHTQMREQLDEVRRRHIGQGVEISISLVPGLAVTALANAEDELAADLLVVGSHNRTGLRRLLEGSVAERIVRLSRRTVLVARNAASRLPYRRILVATDFSPAAEQALRTALSFAAPDADVTLFNSWQLPSSGPGADPFLGRLSKTIEANANAEMDELIRRVEGDYVLRKEVVHGHPAPLIRERAGDCDLIALGSHGRRGLTRFLLGSVAELTVRHAPCSVLVAHGGDLAAASVID